MKYAPWGLSIVLVALLLFVFLSKNGEINNLNQQNAALTEKYNKLVEDANKKQQKLVGEANQLIAAASLPEATVTISFRAAMMGGGSVATIVNTSNDDIPIAVAITRPSNGQSKNYDFVLNGRAVKEIGHAEGWAFVSGDVIAVNQPNHKVKAISLSPR